MATEPFGAVTSNPKNMHFRPMRFHLGRKFKAYFKGGIIRARLIKTPRYLIVIMKVLVFLIFSFCPVS